MAKKKKQVSIDAVRRIVVERKGISDKAARVAAKDKDARMMDYHAGCVGVCLCILGDLDDLAKPNRCSQCGYTFRARACGPTHAAIAASRGVRKATR